jgi:monoamine oxidase
LNARRHAVVVVGAGFCGLAAATELDAAGVDVVVLEARGRVGGRVESQANALGENVDVGGQFFCKDMPEITALAQRFGKAFVKTPFDGRFIVQPPMLEEDAEQAYEGAAAIRERMNAIAPDDPAIAGLTVRAWLDRQRDAAWAKAGFQSMVEGLWCQPISELPLWYLIDNDRRITNEIPELQYFLRETMQSLGEDLAAGLAGRIMLGTPVSIIEHAEGGVALTTPAGRFEAEHVIIAVPPVMASRIAFEPPLPDRLRRALAVWKSGTVIKVNLRYATAFWKETGLSGMVMWRDIHGLFACDTSRDGEHPALVVFVGGPLALQWRALGDEGMRDELKARLVAALGPEAANFTAMVLRDWTNDAWSGGAYSDLIMDLDARDAEAVLREGAGRVHFASSELSPSFPGYIEGAIIAGRIAAGEAMTALEAQSASATSASGS